MKLLPLSPRGLIAVAALLWAAVRATADEPPVPSWVLTHAQGRVMLRTPDKPRVELPKAGRTLAAGEVLITGDQSRLELRLGESGLWRVGRRAVFRPHPEGGRLMAGTALVRVPAEPGWRIESSRGAVLLGRGLWMLQAVDNEGLKIICLDGPSRAEALGETASPAPDAPAAAHMKLRPGELVFLRPGGREFGPIVTVYLEELLMTSRLVNAFPEPLAEARRLLNQGVIQREQLKGVTGALVAGARDEKGFEISVPKKRADAPAK